MAEMMNPALEGATLLFPQGSFYYGICLYGRGG